MYDTKIVILFNWENDKTTTIVSIPTLNFLKSSDDKKYFVTMVNI